MEFDNVPAGFGFALMQNETATNAYAMMTQEQKNEILAKAQKAKSERQMQKIVNAIAKENTLE